MSAFAGALGAFAQGFGTMRQSRNERKERDALDAKLDRFLDGGASPAPTPLGVTGGGGADSGRAANAVTRFEGGGDKDAFIKAMMPHAMRVAKATGLDPRLVIAQSALETGWGKSAPNNNFFGIKSHGRAGGANMATTEYVDGKPVTITDSFRGYADMGESADDYASFLKTNPRYKDLLSAKDLDAQLAALGKSGYATDPNYSRTVGMIARGIPFAQPAPTVASVMNRWPRPLGVGPM